MARLNMSHGDYNWNSRVISNLRAIEKKTGKPIAIIVDLQGSKARIGELGVRSYELRVGQKIIFTTGNSILITHNSITHNFKIPIAVPNFHKYVKKGAHLLIADGTIECVVERVTGKDIHARVILGGELKSHKGIAIAGGSLPLPSITSKDRKDIAWSKTQDIDFVALSFVKKAEDVLALRKLMLRKLSFRTEAELPGIKIIVKIETREAVHNFEEILRVCDGVMIARGDLALATSPEEVPLIQKELIEKCRRRAVPVIVATEMLASMERAPRPTRAEASDVANAVIDHTDAVMLSGESATGAYPIETVRIMSAIIQKTEKSRFDDLSIGGEIHHGNPEEETALLAAMQARTEEAKAIVAGTVTGHTARLLSRYRSEVELIIGTPFTRVLRQINLSWGVRPFLLPEVATRKELEEKLIAQAHASGFKKGSKIVIVSSDHPAPHAQSFAVVKTL